MALIIILELYTTLYGAIYMKFGIVFHRP